LNAAEGKTISFDGGISGNEVYNLNINSDSSDTGSVIINAEISNAAIDIQNGHLYIANTTFIDNFQGISKANRRARRAVLDSSTLNIGNATLHAINNSIETYSSNITFNEGSMITTDVDLSTATADNFAQTTQNGTITITDINYMNAEKTLSGSINIDLSKAMGIDNLSVTEELTNKKITFLNQIRYLTGGVTSDGMLNFEPTGNDYTDFNPEVMASPVAAQLGGYLTQLNAYNQAFSNMDMYMLMTEKERQALKFRNKYAAADSSLIFDPTNSQYNNTGIWARPYATFENVPLKGGPRVSNVSYGTFFGGESEMYNLGHGWDGMYGVYVGYNGSHQDYDGISIYQNGGTLGAVGMAFKGNFFTGLTVNVGANTGEAHSSYGSENFSMLMSGIASKTGYNIELAKGKFIIQPSILVSYSFVDTFNYHNATGAKIDSNPLNAIQIEPGIKFIGNLENGWQPYAGISVVGNILDKTSFRANDNSLPDLSIKPYVRYGLGVRKTWGEKLSGFVQMFFMNGGRNGVGFQVGFRYALGKDGKNKNLKTGNVPELKKAEIKLSSCK
jgi:outer membrane autotransporter protein